MNFQQFEIEGVMLVTPRRIASPTPTAHARALGNALVTANVERGMQRRYTSAI